MFLSDLASLHRASRPFGVDLNLVTVPSSPQGLPAYLKYNTGDPEIDRMYNQSPVIAEFASTYGNDAFKCDDKTHKNPASTIGTWTSSFFISALDGKKTHKTEITFEPKPIPAVRTETSELTKQLLSSQTRTRDSRTAGKLRLTIYLPNTEAMLVHASPQSTFGELIAQILREHREKAIEPALHYEHAEEYELRVHESDGEPDRDFAPLENDKFLRDFSVGDEYCLCEIAREDSDFGAAPLLDGRASVPRNTSAELFSPSQFGTLASSRSRFDSSAKHAPPPRLRSGGDLSEGEREPMDHEEEDDAQYFRRRDFESDRFVDEQDDERDGEREREGGRETDVVTIRLPDGEDLHLPFTQHTTFRELLPLIAKTRKLRIFTDEYIFVISQQDQKHLKLMSPFIEANSKISGVGATFFEIQRKVYADSQVVKKPQAGNQSMSGASRSGMGVNGTRGSIADSVSGPLNAQATPAAPLAAMIASFTEATANAYQEWNVVKKNKFGRRQERVFGVDGRKVYNAKRGALRGGKQVGVHRAERDIETIIKIDILQDESAANTNANTRDLQAASGLMTNDSGSKTFRITWADNNDIYNIEYTTETSRECLEIVAKIKYLMNRLKRQQGVRYMP